MSDLIERLKLARRMVAGQYDMKTIDLAITALSPVLPDDVAALVNREIPAQITLLESGMMNDTGQYEAAVFFRAAIDLLERQAREIEILNITCDAHISEIEMGEKQIEQLGAALEGIAARRDCFSGINGCGAASTARAALQENE